MRFSIFLSFLLLRLCDALPSPQASTSTIATAAPPSPTACGDIINANINSQIYVFNSTLAFQCLTSVPFNPAVASRFLKYYNDTLQFQSTLAYLKNPPASYQQPAVDLIGGLNQIQLDIDNGNFPNQYAFEVALQALIYQTHDAHLVLVAGVLAAFTFGSQYALVSASSDGVELPKVYIEDDLIALKSGIEWQPSPIATINGENVVDYLSQFAAVNSVGTLEPNADWNALFASPALDIQYLYSIFDGFTTFFPGDTLTYVFENGTETGPFDWLAYYNSPGDTGPLSTGGDFYNFFVLGLYPASYNPDAQIDVTSVAADASATATEASEPTTSSSTITPEPTGWASINDYYSAYPPIADVLQPNLGVGGVLTGYFLRDTNTGVLSIPSFNMYGEDLVTFTDTVGEFLEQSKQAGMTKIVIDLQQNGGGNPLLATDTFKQLFPNIDPFGGSRIRAHPAADVLGNTFTTFWQPSLNESYYWGLAANDWVATDYLDADTGRNFTSWPEFYGPYMDNGDYFSTVSRYNLSSLIFDVMASGGIVVYGYNERPATTTTPPYASEDIIILSDALCSSACAMFMEMMHHEAGVRTVVVGGRPSNGPMQSPSGSRGARVYDAADDLLLDIDLAIAINATTGPLLPLSTDVEGLFVTSIGINLHDQIRRGEHIPLQFVYEAATCRIFYTLQTVFDYTALWQYAADAIWSKPQYCVPGSTGYSTTNGTSNTQGPPSSLKANHTHVPYNLTGLAHLTSLTANSTDLFTPEKLSGLTGPRPGDSCARSPCGRSLTCVPVSVFPNCGFPTCCKTCTGGTFSNVQASTCKPLGPVSRDRSNRPYFNGFMVPSSCGGAGVGVRTYLRPDDPPLSGGRGREKRHAEWIAAGERTEGVANFVEAGLAPWE